MVNNLIDFSEPCEVFVNTTCECRKQTQKLSCKLILNNSIKCNLKCSKKYHCKKHMCQNICCGIEYHICELKCEKTLKVFVELN